MARSQFGGSASDFVASTYTIGGAPLLRLASATLYAWDAASSGNRLTDLLVDGVAAETVTVGADGQVPTFEGPDGVTTLWLSAGLTGDRFRFTSQDEAAVSAARTAAEAARDEALAAVDAVPATTDAAMVSALQAPGSSSAAVVDSRAQALVDAEKGAADGVATLDAGGLLPEAQVPTRLTGASLSATFAAPSAIADRATYGNDATDAKAHLQAKADALSTLGGGELLIPRGTYRMSGPLEVPSNVTVRGEGASTVLKATFSGSGLIYNKSHASSGASNITVTDLCVDGNSTANQGVVFAGVKYGTIHNVRVKRCTGYGIWVQASGEVAGSNQGTPSESVTVSSCHITEAIDTGIETAYAKAVTIIGCTVEGTAGQGLYAWAGSQDVTFTGNTVVGVGANNLIAFRVGGLGDTSFAVQTARIAFVGNVARSVKHGIKATGTSGNTPTDIQFGDNSIHTDQASSNGIELNHVKRIMVQGNHLEGFVSPFRVGDVGSLGHTLGSVEGMTVSSNRLYNCGQASFYGLTSGAFNNNTITNGTSHGLYYYGCTGTSLSGNAFINCGNGSNVTAIIFTNNGATESTGNVVIGNRTVDTRATKYLGNVVTLAAASDYNILVGNSAKGARSGTQGVQNAGTGANNVIANNLNA